jgi:hypothetical protein
MPVSYLLLGRALQEILTSVNRPGSQPPSVLDSDQQSQPSQEESNFADSSGPLFSMYSKAAEDEDDKRVDRMKKVSKGIIIFVSL